MAAGTSTVIVCAGAFAAGLALGWFGRGFNDGSIVEADDAAESKQAGISTAVVADRGITAARETTTTAVERVRIETRTVTVDNGCEPGRGPIADADAASLRELVETRADAAARASGMRP